LVKSYKITAKALHFLASKSGKMTNW